ncbi:MAG: DNA repair and recombination protein RadB [Thermoplasmata archaeon]
MERISTGVSTLDLMLRGGYDRGSITMIYGGPGSGKTNLVLNFAVKISKSGKKVIFIDSESLSPERLYSFAEGNKEIASRILINRVKSFSEQEDAIKKAYNLIKKLKNIEAIIVDSFTEFYNLDMDHIESLTSLSKQLGMLESIAEEFSSVILITSRVYYSFKDKKIMNVAGYYMNPAIKTIIRLEKIDDIRKAILEKHKSIKPGKSALFTIKYDSVVGLE